MPSLVDQSGEEPGESLFTSLALLGLGHRGRSSSTGDRGKLEGELALSLLDPLPGGRLKENYESLSVSVLWSFSESRVDWGVW